MTYTANRWIAISILGVMVLSTCGVFSIHTAHAGTKGRRNTALALGAVTLYGLLKRKRTVAIAGGIGTAVAYHRYRQAKKRERGLAEARRSYYPGYSNSSSYSRPYRYSSVAPYRYRSRRSTRSRYASSSRSPRRAYRTASYRRPTSTAKRIVKAPRPSGASRLAAAPLVVPVVLQPVAAPVTAAPASRLAYRDVAPAETAPAVTAPASTKPGDPTLASAATGDQGVDTKSFAVGFLAALLAAGVGMLLPQLLRRRDHRDASTTPFDQYRGHH